MAIPTYPERTVAGLLAIGVLSILLAIGILFSQRNDIVGVSLIGIGIAVILYGVRIWMRVRNTDERNFAVPKMDDG